MCIITDIATVYGASNTMICSCGGSTKAAYYTNKGKMFFQNICRGCGRATQVRPFEVSEPIQVVKVIPK